MTSFDDFNVNYGFSIDVALYDSYFYTMFGQCFHCDKKCNGLKNRNSNYPLKQGDLVKVFKNEMRPCAVCLPQLSKKIKNGNKTFCVSKWTYWQMIYLLISKC